MMNMNIGCTIIPLSLSPNALTVYVSGPPLQMTAYLEGRTTRLSSTETSRSRSSQEDFLCTDPTLVGNRGGEPQYHPGPLGGATTHSGRGPGGSSSSDVPFRCDPVDVCVYCGFIDTINTEHNQP